MRKSSRFVLAENEYRKFRNYLSRPSLALELAGPTPDFIIYDSSLIYYHAYLSRKKGIEKNRKRFGLMLSPNGDSVYVSLYIVHAPGAVAAFKNMIDTNDIRKTSRLLLKLSTSKNIYLGWSSNSLLKKILSKKTKRVKHTRKIEFSALSELTDYLKESKIRDFAEDIGCMPPKTGMKKIRGPAGNYFELGTMVERKDVHKALKVLLPLFNHLYPDGLNYVFAARNSGFNKKLRTFYKKHGKQLVCAYKGCNIKENLEAAHIIPNADGGPDNGKNGVFLCHKHHTGADTTIRQEGKPLTWQRMNLKSEARKGTRIE
ncbi:MAG: HNH endonuclease [Proteobacteria bacterium]|nr:HNH endonuclease [Pseudomonadota bacterium]